jgi:membrane glycosyltransferase
MNTIGNIWGCIFFVPLFVWVCNAFIGGAIGLFDFATKSERALKIDFKNE